MADKQSLPSCVITTPDANGRLAEISKPEWNPQSRRLSFNGAEVKRYKWPAANQEAVLCAFQEEDWPERIDDPLHPQPDQDTKRRLADTIKCLNRKQVNELIHFRGDGTGEGVTWEWTGDTHHRLQERLGIEP
ncbi:hypothetical protein [Roseimaritima multifibrata]|uniref:hypothetical protein n=1 Tax=Roseimaritima multifibrata TaxID=1930274 RepID=UPI0011AB1F5F|nr:hypothetical protein [Roseimaritima multifibrata]